jgi:hypothetical protein
MAGLLAGDLLGKLKGSLFVYWDGLYQVFMHLHPIEA